MTEVQQPSSWITTSLESLISFALGGDWGKAEDHEDLDYILVRCIRASELRSWDAEKGYTAARRKIKKSSLEKRELIEGDILVEVSGGGPDQPVGRTVLIDKAVLTQHPDTKKVCTNFFRLVRPTSKVDSSFLQLYLQSFYKSGRISEYQSGSNNLRNLKFNDYMRISVPLPPINDQRRIVAKIETLFSELDKGIESLKTARKKLKVYRQAVLKHAFEGKLTAQWREENKDKLESPEQLLTRIPEPSQPRGGRGASVEVIEGVGALAVNKPKKSIPSGWEWISLMRVARQETGHTPSRKHPEYWGGNEYWVGIVDARVNHGKVIQDTRQKITPEGLNNSSARTLPAGTVCLSRTASVGYVCILGKPMATSQDFATWTCSEALDPKYLMYAIMAEGEEIRRFGKGTTHTTIYFPEIRALHIALPSLEEQKVIVSVLEEKLQQTNVTLDEIATQVAHAGALRQSILKKAFSGQLTPKDSNEKSARSAL